MEFLAQNCDKEKAPQLICYEALIFKKDGGRSRTRIYDLHDVNVAL